MGCPLFGVPTVVLLGDVDLDAVVRKPLVHLLEPILDALFLTFLAQLRQHDDDQSFSVIVSSELILFLG